MLRFLDKKESHGISRFWRQKGKSNRFGHFLTKRKI